MKRICVSGIYISLVCGEEKMRGVWSLLLVPEEEHSGGFCPASRVSNYVNAKASLVATENGRELCKFASIRAITIASVASTLLGRMTSSSGQLYNNNPSSQEDISARLRLL